jgi:hypothetical protein
MLLSIRNKGKLREKMDIRRLLFYILFYIALFFNTYNTKIINKYGHSHICVAIVALLSVLVNSFVRIC